MRAKLAPIFQHNFSYSAHTHAFPILLMMVVTLRFIMNLNCQNCVLSLMLPAFDQLSVLTYQLCISYKAIAPVESWALN